MKKSILLLSVIALSCLNLKNVSATDLIGEACNFINEFSQKKRLENALQKTQEEIRKQEDIIKCLDNRIESLEKLRADEKRMGTIADMLARAQIIEQELCRSYPGKSIAERSYPCNVAILFTLTLNAMHDDTSPKHISIYGEQVAQANPELAQSVKREPTNEECAEMAKANDFFQVRMSKKAYLKS